VLKVENKMTVFTKVLSTALEFDDDQIRQNSTTMHHCIASLLLNKL